MVDQRAPTATDIEHAVTRFESKLSADHIKLGILRAIYVVVLLRKIGAEIEYVLIR